MTYDIQTITGTALLPSVTLKAGDLTCMYETGKLRYIRKGNTELLRNIYIAVRNEHWGTLPYIIEGEEINAGENAFSISYSAIFGQPDPVYKMICSIVGNPAGTIAYAVKGEALRAFKKNRIGICIHHPIKDCSGRSVLIERPDGSRYESVFPELVSPQQPFVEIRNMQWTTPENSTVGLFFEGDIFETEDQRNWSDSSFKTYSTPLSIPFPVTVQRGDVIEQKITLSVSGGNGLAGETLLAGSEEKIPFPLVGYCRSSNTPLTDEALLHLQKIPFHHYRVTLMMDEPAWRQQLKTSLAEARQLHTRLELVVFLQADYHESLQALLSLLRLQQNWLYSILVLQKDQPVTPPDLITGAYHLIKKDLPGVLIGYGTDQFFADLNRNRPGNTLFDFVSFHLHPQVHASDTRSILENLENQADLVETAKNFPGGKPVFLSPVTFKDRNAPPDERQHTGLAAWWTLMSLQQLAGAGSITYYELMGKDGLLLAGEDQPENAAPNLQPSPLYKALAAIHAFQPVWIIKKINDGTFSPDSLVLEDAAGRRLAFIAPEEWQRFNK